MVLQWLESKSGESAASTIITVGDVLEIAESRGTLFRDPDPLIRYGTSSFYPFRLTIGVYPKRLI